MGIEKDLAAKDLCAIIKTCASAGVDSFTLGELSISFRKKSESVTPAIVPYEASWPSEPEAADAESEQIANRPPPVSEEELQLQIAVEDPVEWERQALEDREDESNAAG